MYVYVNASSVYRIRFEENFVEIDWLPWNYRCTYYEFVRKISMLKLWHVFTQFFINDLIIIEILKICTTTFWCYNGRVCLKPTAKKFFSKLCTAPHSGQINSAVVSFNQFSKEMFKKCFELLRFFLTHSRQILVLKLKC